MINDRRITPPADQSSLVLKEGVNKTQFQQKLEKIVDRGNISKEEFKDLAKSVSGGRESLATFLKDNNIIPSEDIRKFTSFHLGFDSKLKANITDSTAIRKFLIPDAPPVVAEADASKKHVYTLPKDATAKPKAYEAELDDKKAALQTRKTEITGEIAELTEKLKTSAIGSPARKKQNEELFMLKKELSSINAQISKIDEHKKAGITSDSIKGYQASKSGENLYQKVLGTKVYEGGKVSTMLNSDNLGILPSVKPRLKGLMETEHHDEHGHEQFGWASVKDKKVGSKEEMIDLISYRKAFVDQLMKQIKEEFQVEGNMRSVGSTNLTSDYDATILGLTSTKKGEEGRPVSPVVQAQIVAKFNEEFRKEFGVESGTAFDTNIYVDDFKLDERQLHNDPLSPANQKTDNENQDALALVKQRIHMTKPQWDSYVKSVLDGVPEPKRAGVKAQYDKADAYADGREIEINKKIITLNRPDVNISTLKPQEIKDLAESIKSEAGSKAGDVEARALNRLYEEKLVLVKQKEAEFDAEIDPDKKEKLSVEVKKLKGEALFFANEPYFSEGGVRHIVGNLQKMAKKPEKFEITQAQALQSIDENIGDTMKEFEHFSADGFGTLAYKASKYVNRLADAITTGFGNPIPDTQTIKINGKDYNLKDIVADLKSSNLALLDIRGEKVGKELDKTGKAALAVKTYGDNVKLDIFKAVKNPADYQKLLLDITSQVNIKLRS